MVSLIFLSLECFAAEEVELSLSQCLNIGLANNLDIKIAKITPLIKEEGVRSAKSIFDAVLQGEVSYEDDQFAQASTIVGSKALESNYKLGFDTKLRSGTEIEIDYSDKREWTDSIFAVNNPLHTAELSFTVTQPMLKNAFGYIDRRTVKLSKIEAEIAGIESLGNIEDAVADIVKGYWELVFAEYSALLREELLKQAEELYGIFEKHLKTGVAETTELYEVEANMRIRRAQLDIAKNNHITASNKLKLLMNQDGEFLIVTKEALGILGDRENRTESLKEAFSANRKYRTKKKELEKKKISVKMKENALWPEIDLVGTLAVNGVDRKFEKAARRLGTTKHSKYYGGIEVSFPLENREALSEFSTAKLEREKAILELLQVEKELATSVDESVRNVNLNIENAKRWTKIKQIQYEKFTDEEKKLKTGRSSSKIVIDYQNDLTLAALNQYETILRYYLALVDLENTKDVLLSKVGVVEQ